jgi:hypothetical protein
MYPLRIWFISFNKILLLLAVNFSRDDTLITSKAWLWSYCYKVVGNDVMLHHYILQLFHEDTVGGDSGVTATIKRLLQFCTEKDWRNLFVSSLIKSCVSCQQYDFTMFALSIAYIPTAIFTYFTIDFIEGFLKSSGKDVILICCGG